MGNDLGRTESLAPEMEDVRVCPLCESEKAEFLFESKDRLHGLPGKFGLVKCADCGLIRLSPRPIVSKIGFYYPENDYYSYSMVSTFDDGKTKTVKNAIRRSVLYSLGYQADELSWLGKVLSPALRALFFHRATFGAGEKVPRFVAGGRALDIGAGSGVFLSILKNLGWEVYGTDLSASAARVAKEAHDIEIFVGTVEELPFQKCSFDFISLVHSLEHIPDLDQVLRSVRNLLKPTGVCYIEVPNASSLSSRLSGQYWLHWDPPRHLYSFTPKTLSALLEKNRFRIEKLKTLRADFYRSDIAYRRRDEMGVQVEMNSLSYSDKVMAFGLRWWTNLYYRFDRGSGDYLAIWARPISDDI
jgi:2-polyprenyl-3-methyl-5-hydroxy-6-metoxy-1,4-benzoquinol methylase